MTPDDNTSSGRIVLAIMAGSLTVAGGIMGIRYLAEALDPDAYGDLRSAAVFVSLVAAALPALIGAVLAGAGVHQFRARQTMA